MSSAFDYLKLSSILKRDDEDEDMGVQNLNNSRPSMERFRELMESYPERKELSKGGKLVALLSGAFAGPEKVLGAVEEPHRRDVGDWSKRLGAAESGAKMESLEGSREFTRRMGEIAAGHKETELGIKGREATTREKAEGRRQKYGEDRLQIERDKLENTISRLGLDEKKANTLREHFKALEEIGRERNRISASKGGPKSRYLSPTSQKAAEDVAMNELAREDPIAEGFLVPNDKGKFDIKEPEDPNDMPRFNQFMKNLEKKKREVLNRTTTSYGGGDEEEDDVELGSYEDEDEEDF